jgi:hypothetical protein
MGTFSLISSSNTLPLCYSLRVGVLVHTADAVLLMLLLHMQTHAQTCTCLCSCSCL